MQMSHVGKHADRLSVDCHSSDRERAFAERWKLENDRYRATLLSLLHSEMSTSGIGFPAQVQTGELTQDEATVAATVIQWLGTNCGFDFVRIALENCGYEIRRKEAACKK